jgi:hypothetical protein
MPGVGLVRVFVKVIDAGGVEEGAAAFDAVDLVAFIQQKLGEIRPILSCDAGDQSFLQNVPRFG